VTGVSGSADARAEEANNTEQPYIPESLQVIIANDLYMAHLVWSENMVTHGQIIETNRRCLDES